MRVAICGYPPLADKIQAKLKSSEIDCVFFIRDFISLRGKDDKLPINLPTVKFFEFRRLINTGKLDGLIIAEDGRTDFTRNLVSLCKLYSIPQVGIVDLILPNPVSSIYWLDANKAYIPYLNTNVVDGCNLNCKGCTHFAAFFKTDEIYPLETFQRDVSMLSQTCDIISFRLLGGEPLLLKNLDEYIKTARQYLPKSNLGIVTNGLLLPSTSQKILDTLRENNFMVYVSVYQPTEKILDQIKTVLVKNNIFYKLSNPIKNFGVFLTLHAENNPKKSRKACAGNESCRFLRDGKIYKCPPDALNFRFWERFGILKRFGIESYPAATGVDLHAPNFSLLLKMLDDNIEMCNWCSEQCRYIPWQQINYQPELDDWLANLEELGNFFSMMT